MVRHILKFLQHLLQDFWSVPDHFGTLCIKGLINISVKHLWLSMFAKIVKCKRPLTIFAKKNHHRYLTRFWIRMCKCHFWHCWLKWAVTALSKQEKLFNHVLILTQWIDHFSYLNSQNKLDAPENYNAKTWNWNKPLFIH